VNPPAAVQRPAAGPASLHRRRPRTPIVLGALAIVAALLISQLLASPHYVSRITVDNPSNYEMLVEASNGRGDGWLSLGTADHRGPTEFEQVYDIGDVWKFRVSAQGQDLGTFQRTRAQLEQAHWHVALPHRMGDALQAAGVPPQP
jgi:hypothetical protein